MAYYTLYMRVSLTAEKERIYGILCCISVFLLVYCVPSAISVTAETSTPPIILAGILDLEQMNGGDLIYSADAGSLLHDPMFALHGNTYTIAEVRVKPTEFLLRIQQEGQETDEQSVLNGHYMVFKRNFSVIGYIDAVHFASDTDEPNLSSVLLSRVTGLQQDDFLRHITFEITRKKPDTINRYPEEIQQFGDIEHALTDGSLTIDLREYFADPERSNISAEVDTVGDCCIVRAETVEHALTITPITPGTITADIRVYDATGLMTTKEIEITITSGDPASAVDVISPRIVTEGVLKVVSSRDPSISIVIDHRQAAQEDLEIVFGGNRACGQLTANDIHGTTVGGMPVGTLYTGTLTGGIAEMPVVYYGYDTDADIGHLIPSVIEMNDTVFNIKKLIHTYAHTPRIQMQIEPEDIEQIPTEDIFAEYHLVFRGRNGIVIGSVPMEKTVLKDATYHLSADNILAVHQKWFDGTENMTVEITRTRPGEIGTLSPQTYTIPIKGPSGIYDGCALSVLDTSGNRANEWVPLSIFTIFRSKEEEEALYQQVRGPAIPKQLPTPKKQHTLFRSREEIKSQRTLIEMRRLAIKLADPGVSISSVQHVPIGRRAEIPEVRDLQIFLNIAGYTVAHTGPGSRGSETMYFGPATQRALEAFQKENNIPVTGEFDQKTQETILIFATQHFLLESSDDISDTRNIDL